MHGSRADTGLLVRYGHPWPDTAVLTVAGEIDLLSLPQLRHALYDALDEVGTTRVTRLIVDLAEVDFLAACGATLLARVRQRARESGCEVVLVVTDRHVHRVLEITRTLPVLSVYDDVLAAFAAPPADKR